MAKLLEIIPKFIKTRIMLVFKTYTVYFPGLQSKDTKAKELRGGWDSFMRV